MAKIIPESLLCSQVQHELQVTASDIGSTHLRHNPLILGGFFNTVWK